MYALRMCCIVLLTLFVGGGNALAKKPKFDESSVTEITLDVVRVEACAKRKGCVVAGGPMQVNLLDMAKDNIDYVNQVLLPEKTKELRLVLGDNNTITVDDEAFPLTVPSGQTSGLKLKGQKVFGKEGGLLSGLTLDLNLQKQLVVQAKKSKSKGKGKGKKASSDDAVTYSYKLKPVIKVATAEITPMTDEVAAVVAMPGEESEIRIGETFSLVIPAGAVSTPMVISVKETKYTVEVMDEETGEVVEKPALSSNYELSPDGAEFAEPLVITIPYQPDTLPPDVSEYDLSVYLDGEKLPTDINTVLKTATADVWHFSSASVSYYTPICPSGNGLYCGGIDSSLDDNTLYYCQNGNYQVQEYCFNGCETMPAGTNDKCGSGTAPQPSGNFVFPFAERDSLWQICQGYNTPNISHLGNLIHSFDFAYGSGNLGNTGCWGNPGGSENKTVVAPAAGTVLWNGTNDTDITCFQLENTVSNGHGDQIASVKLGHMKSNSARAGAGQYRAQGELIGKLCGPTGCPSVGGYAHTHIGAYTTTNCTGKTVPFGNVFGSGYDFSSNGSLYQWHGTEIPSDDPEPASCPDGNGLYCGKSNLNQNTSYLYYCQNGNYTVQEQCSNGCETMPSGTNDQCKDVPASCPYGNGLYCGDSSLNQNTSYLYYCQNGNYTVQEQCSNGCETMSAGTNDQCKDAPATCPDGNGLYCGKSSLNQNTSYLYYCQNGSYSVQEQCSNGCETMPSGTNDQCKDVPASCPYGNGLYCGDSSLNQNPSYLYYCQDGSYTVQEQCTNGCQVMDPYVNDKCMSASSTIISNVTGRVWMALDLGQTKAAQDYGDPNAQGSLYQWGRRTDGHESRTSETSDEVISATESSPKFITDHTWFSEYTYPGGDWNALNNPCPEGFVVPTVEEFLAEYPAGVPIDYSDNVLGLGGSSGYRSAYSGKILDSSTNPYIHYWTADYTDNPGTYPTSITVFMYPGDALDTGISDLGYGASVRCIKSL